MAVKKAAAPKKELSKIEQAFVDTFGDLQNNHKGEYVTIAKLEELTARLDGSYKEPEADENEQTES